MHLNDIFWKTIENTKTQFPAILYIFVISFFQKLMPRMPTSNTNNTQYLFEHPSSCSNAAESAAATTATATATATTTTTTTTASTTPTPMPTKKPPIYRCLPIDPPPTSCSSKPCQLMPDIHSYIRTLFNDSFNFNFQEKNLFNRFTCIFKK